MANIYESDVYRKNARLRPDSQVGASEATFSIVVPALATLADGDLFYFSKIGENVDIMSAELLMPAFDSSSTPDLAGSLGSVISTTAKTATAVEGVTGYNSILAGNTILTGASSTDLTITKHAGGGTAGTFNLNPYPVNTAVTDLVMVITAGAESAITAGDKVITLRVKYQYKYPGTLITGVSDPRYPFAGSITYGTPVQYDYNDNAP